MKNLKENILNQLEKKLISQQEAVMLLKELQQAQEDKDEPIAIIGAACRLPMSGNVDEFWDNIINNRNCFVTKPVEKLKAETIYANPYYAEMLDRDQFTEDDKNVEKIVGAFVEDFDKFDAGFFGIPPREAKYIDPQQRVFLETAWSAIEDAGYSENSIKNSKTGVYVGRDGTNTIYYKHITEDDPMKLSGFWEGILASRINYIYNLTGAAMVIDTACSSGLVAMHQACNALKAKECDMAVAGGICICNVGGKNTEKNDSTGGDESAVNSVLSDDNRVRSFDKKCSGTVFGEGVVVFLLKPLKKALLENDHIYTIIKGSAVNSDGASNGLTAPNPVAQEAVITEAWEKAKIDPLRVSYVETHGTGTLLGDPIEVLGLRRAFGRYTDRMQFCGIGSVKTNIGHSVAASGCANVLKVALAMQHHMIPASLNFEEPNPHINFIDSPIYVVDKNQEWKDDKQPLLAGVNSFGFSGTNAHMVLEEATMVKQHKPSGKINMIALSARTLTSMKQLIKNYSTFVTIHKDLNIDDVCYTANTGRGHYNYRLAMIVDSYEDFIEKLGKIDTEHLEEIQDDEIFYGVHTIVSDKRKVLAENEICESSCKQLTESAAVQLTSLAQNDTDREECKKLCSIYVKGASVDWKQLYDQKNCYKVSLPTYPFDRTSYWGEEKVSKLSNKVLEDQSKTIHPLVKRVLVESMNENIYQVVFNLSTDWVLQEHKIMGSNIVSGTTFIEVMREALEQYFQTNRLLIKDVVFLKPLAVSIEDGDVEAQVIVTKKDSDAEICILSKHQNEDGEFVWAEHARGTACINDQENVKSDAFAQVQEKVNLKLLDIKMPDSSEVSAFGPRWRCVEHCYRQEDSQDDVFYSVIALPEQFKQDVNEYKYHPGMLDMAVNFPTFAFYAKTEFFLPFSYHNFRIYQNLPDKFYSRMVKIDKKSDEIMSFYIQLVSMDGSLLAEIDECSVKKVSHYNDFVSNSYYQRKWIPYEGKENEETPQQINGTILIIKDKMGLAEKFSKEIKNNMNSICMAEFGKAYKKIDENHFIIGYQEDDYNKLISNFTDKGIDYIYHLANVDFDTRKYGLEQYSEQLNKGLYSMLYLSKACANYIHKPINWILMTDYAFKVTGNEPSVKPTHASFISIIKSILYEFQENSFRGIDIDEDTNTDALFHEMLCSYDTCKCITMRNGQKYIECIDTFDVKESKKKDLVIKEDGVYIITGGFGGLGLEVASNLALRGKCNICLVGRTKLPPEEEWDQILEENKDERVCNIIQSLKKLQTSSSKFIFRYCDISNYNKTMEMIDNIRKIYHNINGIVHCAGVAGGGFLYSKSLDTFQSVIAPKIIGTAVLDELTKKDQRDFFILYSSMVSLYGGPGQSDYTVANTFLNAYSESKRMEGINIQTIMWPGWSEIGMATRMKVNNTMPLFNSLSTQSGMSAFDAFIGSDMNNLIPGSINYESFEVTGEESLTFILSDRLKSHVKRKGKNNNAENQDINSLVDASQLQIIGKSEAEYTDTEKTVAYIYATVLNLNEIDIYENFSSLGGDSIIATEVLRVLNKQYNNILNISDMFTYSCVEEMAAYIDSHNKTEEIIEEKNMNEMLDDFTSGDIDVDDMISYFDEEK